MDFAEILESEAPAYGLKLAKAQIEKLRAYHLLLEKWNARVDLTSERDPLRLARYHFLESMYAAGFIDDKCRAHLDIGSGAGFPAIPLKLARPDLAQTLLEPRRRRAAFLKEVCRELGLVGTKVLSLRLEDYCAAQDIGPFDLVTMRGLALEAAAARKLVERLRPGCRLAIWHGEEAGAVKLLLGLEGIEEVDRRLLPRSNRRYLSLLRKA